MKSYYDIVGDGGSRIVEQVGAMQAAIGEKLAGVKHRLAIGSGKGGVGKSTLTRQLATALRQRGNSCAILDADINGPSQARLSGLRGVPLLPGADGVALPRDANGVGVVSLGSLVPEGEAVSFDAVSDGDSYTWRATREFTAVAELLASIDWGQLDYLLFDLPPGAERTFQFAEFLGSTTSFLLVTVPSDLARGVVSRSVAALRDTPNRVLGFVENMDGYWCDACHDVRPLFPKSDRIDLGIPKLGSVPFDPELAAACDRGELAVGNDRPWWIAVEKLALAVEEAIETKPAEETE
jgi:ATP-binding protein involved in chromosome partitioning